MDFFISPATNFFVAISANDKIEMESKIKSLKSKYQKKRGFRQQQLLSNQIEHMEDVPLESVTEFLEKEEIRKG